MPRIARNFLVKLLENQKRKKLLAGDRTTREAIDALLTHVSDARYIAALHTFDALQRSANALTTLSTLPNKPKYFTTLESKNAWDLEEETASARKAQQTSAVTR